MKNKYNIGDKVFYIENNMICNKSITGIIVKRSDFLKKKTVVYSFAEEHYYYEPWIEQKYLFPSKEELLASL